MSKTCFWTLTLVALMGTAPAGATIVRSFTLTQMTLEADAVVRGEVVFDEPIYDEFYQRVYTISWVRVHEVLAGHDRPGDMIAVKQIGGIIDGIEWRVVGTAQLDMGAEVVLFARTDGAYHYLVGMAQGMYEVTDDGQGQGLPLVRKMAGVQRAPLVGPSRATAPNRLTLESLRQRVALTQQGGPR